jgi:hypothetical protein
MHYIYIYRIWLGRVCNWCCNKIIPEITIDAHMYYRLSQKLKQLFGILFSFHRSASHQGFTDTTYSTENETRASHMWREHHTCDANNTHVSRTSHMCLVHRTSHMWREYHTCDANIAHLTRAWHMWREHRTCDAQHEKFLEKYSTRRITLFECFKHLTYICPKVFTHTQTLSLSLLRFFTSHKCKFLNQMIYHFRQIIGQHFIKVAYMNTKDSLFTYFSAQQLGTL